MTGIHLITSFVLTTLTMFGALRTEHSPAQKQIVYSDESLSSRVTSFDFYSRNDSAEKAQPDTFTPPMLGPSLRYGMDTTVSPCVDFYQYVNGDWRARTKLGNVPERQTKMVEIFGDTYRRTQLRLRDLLDSAYSVANTTSDPTLKAVGTFYGSCMKSDSLERVLRSMNASQTPVRDSTRAEQCLQRTLVTMGGALGQAFANTLLASHARERMEELLESLRLAAIKQLEANPWMTADEKSLALERLRKLKLRVGIPDKLVDYRPLVLTDNYFENKKEVANFGTQQMVTSIGSDAREQWKMSLLRPNASYIPFEHAIEVPPIMFMPPFFDVNAEDALNYAAIGLVIGHEIFHSIAPQLPSIAHPSMKSNIELFKQLNSELGTLDGWNTDGKRTFQEDIADHGGIITSYAAWKATLKKKGKHAAKLVDGFTPDQRYFIGIARAWRAKWKGGLNTDVHAAPFARTHAMILNAPQFAEAFGCKVGDPMVRPADKRITIW